MRRSRARRPVDFALTERPRHAVEIADAAKAGRDTVVATGGDGSIHEVANGLMLAKDEGAPGTTKLGIIGRGRAGTSAKTCRGSSPGSDRGSLSVIAGRAQPIQSLDVTYVDTNGSPRVRHHQHPRSALPGRAKLRGPGHRG